MYGVTIMFYRWAAGSRRRAAIYRRLIGEEPLHVALRVGDEIYDPRFGCAVHLTIERHLAFAGPPVALAAVPVEKAIRITYKAVPPVRSLIRMATRGLTPANDCVTQARMALTRAGYHIPATVVTPMDLWEYVNGDERAETLDGLRPGSLGLGDRRHRASPVVAHRELGGHGSGGSG